MFAEERPRDFGRSSSVSRKRRRRAARQEGGRRRKRHRSGLLTDAIASSVPAVKKLRIHRTFRRTRRGRPQRPDGNDDHGMPERHAPERFAAPRSGVPKKLVPPSAPDAASRPVGNGDRGTGQNRRRRTGPNAVGTCVTTTPTGDGRDNPHAARGRGKWLRLRKHRPETPVHRKDAMDDRRIKRTVLRSVPPMSKNAEERRVLTRDGLRKPRPVPRHGARTAPGKQRRYKFARIRRDEGRGKRTDRPLESVFAPCRDRGRRGPAKESADAQFLRGHIAASPVSLRHAPGAPAPKGKTKKGRGSPHVWRTSSALSLFSCAASTISSRNGAPPFSAGRFDAGRSVDAPHRPAARSFPLDAALRQENARERKRRTARRSGYLTSLVL